MKRRIVEFIETRDSLTVLADDGTLWTVTRNGTQWRQYPPLPDREEDHSADLPF